MFEFSFTPPLDELLPTADALQAALLTEGSALLNATLPNFLDDLRTPPGKSIVMQRNEWSSDRQYFAHLATLNWGRGLPYVRKGTVSDAWGGQVSANADSVTVRVENINPEAVYVYGSLASEDGKPQQRFHRKTGWRVARILVLGYFTSALEDVGARVFERWWKG